MDNLVYSKSNFIIVFLLILKHTRSAEECKLVSPCLCEFKDQTVLDISNLLPDNNFIKASYIVPNSSYTFYFHGCKDASFHLTNNSDIESDNCTYDKIKTGLTLCLVQNYISTTVNTTTKLTSLTNLGNSSLLRIEHEAEKENPRTQDIIFQTTAMLVRIQLICAPDLSRTQFLVKSISTAEYNLEIASAHGCRILKDNGLSTGSKLIIMLSVGIIVYLIGGSCILYFLKGARGAEMIPNIDFWSSLPGLVRDGVIYLMNGCNPVVVPTSDSYDRI